MSTGHVTGERTLYNNGEGIAVIGAEGAIGHVGGSASVLASICVLDGKETELRPS